LDMMDARHQYLRYTETIPFWSREKSKGALPTCLWKSGRGKRAPGSPPWFSNKGHLSREKNRTSQKKTEKGGAQRPWGRERRERWDGDNGICPYEEGKKKKIEPAYGYQNRRERWELAVARRGNGGGG